MIVDNFLESPSYLRQHALNLEFFKPFGIYPGLRTKPLNEIDEKLFLFLTNKIISLLYDFNKVECEYHMQMQFQLINKKFETGWFHDDEGSDFAGVLYLNPNAPLNGGTIISGKGNDCRKNFNLISKDSENIKHDFYNDKEVNIELYRQKRDSHNSTFIESLVINNIFNRLIMYDAKVAHRENIFFGEDKDSSRLTLVFFAKVKTNSFNDNGLYRSKHIFTY